MKPSLFFLGGLLMGACAMFYLDARSGGRRRARVRDKLVGAGHEVADLAQEKAKRAADRAKGMVAARSLGGQTRSEPESDLQLHERIRARLGRVVSHPRSVHVDVEQGSVRLWGHILSKEVDDLLHEVRSMAGVTDLRNDLQAHDTPGHLPELQGRTEPRGSGTPGPTTWH